MKKHLWLKILAVTLLLLVAAFFLYVSDYYRAEPPAAEALRSSGAVRVTETDFGWLFDGPGEEEALIFYPGGKVEAASYAPLLRRLAEGGMDVCLVEMPLRLAFLDIDKAETVMAAYDYPRWYIGGHSLGGAMAAVWAASNGDRIDGLILLAAYPTRPLDADLTEILIVGSEDGVVNGEKLREGAQYAPEDLTEAVIPGGNHAQFGCYGPQKGDGEAGISAEEQQAETVRLILAHTTP